MYNEDQDSLQENCCRYSFANYVQNLRVFIGMNLVEFIDEHVMPFIQNATIDKHNNDNHWLSINQC